MGQQTMFEDFTWEKISSGKNEMHGMEIQPYFNTTLRLEITRLQKFCLSIAFIL